MKSVITAVVTGVLTLVGVLVSNSRRQTLLEVKIDKLVHRVEKHNSQIKRRHAIENKVSMQEND